MFQPKMKVSRPLNNTSYQVTEFVFSDISTCDPPQTLILQLQVKAETLTHTTKTL